MTLRLGYVMAEKVPETTDVACFCSSPLAYGEYFEWHCNDHGVTTPFELGPIAESRVANWCAVGRATVEIPLGNALWEIGKEISTWKLMELEKERNYDIIWQHVRESGVDCTDGRCVSSTRTRPD